MGVRRAFSSLAWRHGAKRRHSISGSPERQPWPSWASEALRWIRFSFSSKRANRPTGRFEEAFRHHRLRRQTDSGMIRRANFDGPDGVARAVAWPSESPRVPSCWARRGHRREFWRSRFFLGAARWAATVIFSLGPQSRPEDIYYNYLYNLWFDESTAAADAGGGATRSDPEVAREGNRTWNGARGVIENFRMPGRDSATSVTAGWGPSRARGRGDPRDERRRDESVGAAAERGRLARAQKEGAA